MSRSDSPETHASVTRDAVTCHAGCHAPVTESRPVPSRSRSSLPRLGLSTVVNSCIIVEEVDASERVDDARCADDPDLCHIACCKDEAIALCGIDLAGEDWVPDDYAGDHCEECVDRADLDCCPVSALRSLR